MDNFCFELKDSIDTICVKNHQYLKILKGNIGRVGYFYCMTIPSNGLELLDQLSRFLESKKNKKSSDFHILSIGFSCIMIYDNIIYFICVELDTSLYLRNTERKLYEKKVKKDESVLFTKQISENYMCYITDNNEIPKNKIHEILDSKNCDLFRGSSILFEISPNTSFSCQKYNPTSTIISKKILHIFKNGYNLTFFAFENNHTAYIVSDNTNIDITKCYQYDNIFILFNTDIDIYTFKNTDINVLIYSDEPYTGKLILKSTDCSYMKKIKDEKLYMVCFQNDSKITEHYILNIDVNEPIKTNECLDSFLCGEKHAQNYISSYDLGIKYTSFFKLFSNCSKSKDELILIALIISHIHGINTNFNVNDHPKLKNLVKYYKNYEILPPNVLLTVIYNYLETGIPNIPTFNQINKNTYLTNTEIKKSLDSYHLNPQNLHNAIHKNIKKITSLNINIPIYNIDTHISNFNDFENYFDTIMYDIYSHTFDSDITENIVISQLLGISFNSTQNYHYLINDNPIGIIRNRMQYKYLTKLKFNNFESVLTKKIENYDGLKLTCLFASMIYNTSIQTPNIPELSQITTKKYQSLYNDDIIIVCEKPPSLPNDYKWIVDKNSIIIPKNQKYHKNSYEVWISKFLEKSPKLSNIDKHKLNHLSLLSRHNPKCIRKHTLEISVILTYFIQKFTSSDYNKCIDAYNFFKQNIEIKYNTATKITNHINNIPFIQLNLHKNIDNIRHPFLLDPNTNIVLPITDLNKKFHEIYDFYKYELSSCIYIDKNDLHERLKNTKKIYETLFN